MPSLRLALRSTPRWAVVPVLAVALFLQMAPITAMAAEEPDRMGQAQDETLPHSPSHILVKLAAPSQAFRTLGTSLTLSERDGSRSRSRPARMPIEFAREMSARTDVETAELDLILTQQATPPFASPDPDYVNTSSPFYQWHLHSANVGGAWQTTVGTGVTSRHPRYRGQ